MHMSANDHNRECLMNRTVNSVAMIVAVASAIGGLSPVPRSAATSTTNAAYVQPQVSGPLDAQPTQAARDLLVIAHNAGDAASTTTNSVRHHARVIEIDTSLEGSQLRARHDPAPTSANDIVTRSQTVSKAWAQAKTPGILLDLKTSGTPTTQLVAKLLAGHPATDVLVSTSSQQTLAEVGAADPRTLRLLSVGTVAQLRSVLENKPSSAYAGVSIANGLLTAETTQGLKQHHLWIQAWTVDTMLRANQLAAWGVSGITTDNLSMLAALNHSPV